jgi:hypothetical protein
VTSALASAPRANADAEPLCPLRPGAACTLCFPGATGPGNCGRVYLVMSDPDLRAELTERWAEYEAQTAAREPTGRGARSQLAGRSTSASRL